jgi:hypothetical protein
VQGRFTSTDEFKGGPDELWVLGSGDPEKQALVYADITNPQSLNKYQYCFNNPLKYVDPDGHQEEVAAYHAELRRLLEEGKITKEEYQREIDGFNRGYNQGNTIGLAVVAAGVAAYYSPRVAFAILAWASRNPDTAQRMAEEAVQMSSGNPMSAPKLGAAQVEALGKSIGQAVMKMERGQMATIAAKVTEGGLGQAQAVTAIQTAIKTVGKSSVVVPQANGTVVVASVMAGTNKGVLIVNAKGAVSQATATIKVGVRDGKPFFDVTDIVPR